MTSICLPSNMYFDTSDSDSSLNNDDHNVGAAAVAPVFPIDCMQLEDVLPQPNLKELFEQVEIQVLVLDVYSPSHIWLEHIGDDIKQYKKIMDEINEYYDHDGEGASRHLAPEAVVKGYYCCGKYENLWRRVRIGRILNAVYVMVWFVDLGKVDMLPIWDLRPMLLKWGEVPARALRARLSCVKPKKHAKSWDPEVGSFLYKMVKGDKIIASFTDLDESTDVFKVLLFYVQYSGGRVCINGKLKEVGRLDLEGIPPKSSTHHLPDFYALENALTPTNKELICLQKAGIDFKNIPDYVKYCVHSYSDPSVCPATLVLPPTISITHGELNKFNAISKFDFRAAILYLNDRFETAILRYNTKTTTWTKTNYRY